jgi:hypothetical protein
VALWRHYGPTTLGAVQPSTLRATPHELGIATAGAVHLDDCRRAGMTSEAVKWLLESGRWQSVFPRVYATFSGPVPLITRQHAALLYAGDGAVLSHESAGRCCRLSKEPPVIHVTVPYCRQVDAQPGLVIHRSRTLREEDVHPVFVPRRTSVERTVVDLLPGCTNTDAALGLVADALRWPLTTPDTIRDALLAKPCTPWRKVILEALPDLRAGARSALELRDAKMRKAHQLPQGTRQFTRLGDGTEHLDVLIEEFRTHVELDGRLGHDRGREVWRDMRRDNRSEVARLRHLRYGWSDLFDRSCEVAIEQAVILRQQGWQGEFKRCRSCPPTLPPGL